MKDIFNNLLELGASEDRAGSDTESAACIKEAEGLLFPLLRSIQIKLTNMSKDEFVEAFSKATSNMHPTWYTDDKFQQFLENPILFTTTRLDEKTGAKFLELCMNS